MDNEKLDKAISLKERLGYLNKKIDTLRKIKAGFDSGDIHRIYLKTYGNIDCSVDVCDANLAEIIIRIALSSFSDKLEKAKREFEDV
jgi:hypothetical protein